MKRLDVKKTNWNCNVNVFNIHGAFVRSKKMCLNYNRKCNEFE